MEPHVWSPLERKVRPLHSATLTDDLLSELANNLRPLHRDAGSITRQHLRREPYSAGASPT
jgi:hypothetical protein